MIIFRCWYCDKTYAVAPERIGTTLTCTCKNLLRIPKRNHGRCRIRKPLDYTVETLVYGGGGGFLGFGLGLLIVARLPWFVYGGRRRFILVCTLVGFCAGFFGGEAGVNWLGRRIREREES